MNGGIVLDNGVKLRCKMPEKPECFFGREKELQKLREHFVNGNNVVFLQGIGGIGKSELAVSYALAYREVYDIIVFAKCIHNLRTMIASDVEIPMDNLKRNTIDVYYVESEEDYFERKYEALKTCVTEKTLLVVDNFNCLEDDLVDDFLKLDCDILLTSRLDWSEKRYPVLQLKEIEAMDDLMKIFCHYYLPQDVEEEMVIIEIIKNVCSYTLAVEWIAKQLTEQMITPRQMLTMLQEKNTSNQTDKMNASVLFHKLAEVFSVSGLSEEEKSVLRCMCLVPYTGISKEELIKRGTKGSHMATLKLLRSSWLKQIELDVVTLHPVVAEAVSFALQPRWDNTGFFTDSIARDLLEEELSIEQVDQLLQFAGNIMRVLETKDPKGVGLIYAAGYAFQKYYNKYDIAIGLLEKAEELQQKRIEEIRAKIAICRNKDAIDVEYNHEKQSLIDAEKIKCRILHTIGTMYYESGAYEHALSYYIKVSKSPMMDVYCDIAKVYAKVKEHYKAMDYVQAGIKIKKTKYGSNEIPLVESYLLLADIAVDMEDKHLALQWLEKAYNIAEMQMEPSEKSKFYFAYASVLKRMNLVKDALEIDQKNYILRKRLYGEQHMQTVYAYAAMAVDYYRLGDYESALVCTLCEIRIRKQLRKVKKNLYLSVSRLINLVNVNGLDEEVQDDLKQYMSDFNRILKENPKEGCEWIKQ